MKLGFNRTLGIFVLAALIATLVLAACGGDEDDGDAVSAAEPAATTASNTPTAAEDTADETESEATEEGAEASGDATTEPADAGGTQADTGGESTSVETAFGVVEFPANPERVITIGDLTLDSALALGIQPVGATASRGSQSIAGYLEDDAGDLTVIGTLSEPDLEMIVQLQPDVILTEWWIEEDLYKRLSQLAPTFVPLIEEGGNTNAWDEQFRAYAEVLGRADEAEQALAQVDERLEAVKTAIAGHEGESVTVMRWMPQGPVIMSGNLITGQILSGLGLSLPELAKGIEGGHTEVLSLENLAEINTDWLVVATLNAEAEDALDAAREQEVFRRLSAVESDQVITVNGQLWSSTSGPLAALEILNDIEQGMAGTS